NALIAEHGFSGEVDLLSIDVDGVDYWLWKAIDGIRPRVVVVECNTLIGPDRSVAVPYRPDFRSEVPGHAGASPAALVKLGRQKGSRLVGCQLYGFNAFFVRDDLGADLLPEAPVARCYDHPHAGRAVEQGRRELGGVPWVEV